MRFDFNGQSYQLNQRQLDAINPAWIRLFQRKLAEADFEAECLALMIAAGCPPGYDTGLRHDADLPERIARWRTDGRVGLSSLSIWYRMTGSQPPADGWHHPLDVDDLNRCLLLLDLIPEWQLRMEEMAVLSKHWAALAAIWPELSACFLREVGLNGCHGSSAVDTWALMKSALEQA